MACALTNFHINGPAHIYHGRPPPAIVANDQTQALQAQIAHLQQQINQQNAQYQRLQDYLMARIGRLEGDVSRLCNEDMLLLKLGIEGAWRSQYELWSSHCKSEIAAGNAKMQDALKKIREHKIIRRNRRLSIEEHQETIRKAEDELAKASSEQPADQTQEDGSSMQRRIDIAKGKLFRSRRERAKALRKIREWDLVYDVASSRLLKLYNEQKSYDEKERRAKANIEECMAQIRERDDALGLHGEEDERSYQGEDEEEEYYSGTDEGSENTEDEETLVDPLARRQKRKRED